MFFLSATHHAQLDALYFLAPTTATACIQLAHILGSEMNRIKEQEGGFPVLPVSIWQLFYWSGFNFFF